MTVEELKKNKYKECAIPIDELLFEDLISIDRINSIIEYKDLLNMRDKVSNIYTNNKFKLQYVRK